MKRKQLTLAAVLFPILAFSQTITENAPTVVSEQGKDTAEFVSIADIIKEKEETSSRGKVIKHFDNVWGRRSYLNISYNKSTLSPKEDTRTGIGNALVGDIKSNIGVSLQYGKSFRLHKKPIANVLQFYLDYTGIDLSFNHYKIGNEGINVFNSAAKYEVREGRNGTTLNSYYYIPWNLEKYEGSYGMTLGPSITVAPFTHINNKNGLHFLKLNMYFHIGYQASILWMVGNDDADMNPDDNSADFKEISETLKMNWGHGLLTSFGLSLTWKAIGIGYEHRVAQNKWKPASTTEFGSDTYKFKTVTDRIYLSFRLGK